MKGAGGPVIIQNHLNSNDSDLTNDKICSTKIIDSNLESDSMLFVDSATIEVKRLLAPTLLTDLPTNKLGTRDAVVSFVTAQNVAEYKNGLITGIADPTD